MDFLAVGAVFFLFVIAFSVATELRDRHGEGSNDDFHLLPRRDYNLLHGEIYHPPLAPPPLTEGKFHIKRAERPTKCEVCHHTDQFEITSGHCSRCNHVTP